MRPGRHGGMASGEFESIIARNGNFLSVIRAGSGDGQAGLYNSISGEYLGGIGGGWLPEYSRHLKDNGTGLLRGWRNVAYELLARGRLRPTREITRLLGYREALDARDYGLVTSPIATPEPEWNHSSIRS